MKAVGNYLLLIVVVTTGIILVYSVISQGTQESYSPIRVYNPISRRNQKESINGKPTGLIPGSKWIVVTSIQYPTEDVKQLASNEGWNLVVVADSKTPNDWSYEGVHFLSLSKQKELFDEYSDQLPLNSYTRKNLGYLYAIMNGAEWIYDTDDDNKPYNLGLKQFDYEPSISGLRYVNTSNVTSECLFNPYRFYGFDNMWPRGFPLEYLEGHTNGRDRMITCRNMRRPAVQQGIVVNDPDVDAIYRQTGLNVTFNSVAPPIVLEQGTYSPWNSQNTLFHYKAFFILYLPTTVAFRVTDIWRSYFGQKLLHLIGENVAFYPANAVQFRNAHNYLNDFKQETDVYHESGKMVEFLDDWSCSQDDIKKCTLQLADKFVELEFFAEEDRDLIEGWLNQLTALGYKFPLLVSAEIAVYKIMPSIRYQNCRQTNLDVGVAHYHSSREDVSWATRTIDGFGEVLDWCDVENATTDTVLPSPEKLMTIVRENPGLQQKMNTNFTPKYPFQALVLMANFPWSFHKGWRTVVGLLQRLYSPYFKATIFCGTWTVNTTALPEEDLKPLDPISFVYISAGEMRGGYAYGYCISKVRDMRLQNVSGYFFVADDSVFSVWYDLPLDKVVNPHPIHPAGQWWSPGKINDTLNLMAGKYKNEEKYQKSWKDYQEQILKAYGNNISFRDYYLRANKKIASDFIYLPAHKIDHFANLIEVWTETSAMIEFAMGKIMDGMDYVKDLPFKYLWDGGSRRRAMEIYNLTKLGVHPVKMAYLSRHTVDRARFCNSIVDAYVKMIYNRASSTNEEE